MVELKLAVSLPEKVSEQPGSVENLVRMLGKAWVTVEQDSDGDFTATLCGTHIHPTIKGNEDGFHCDEWFPYLDDRPNKIRANFTEDARQLLSELVDQLDQLCARLARSRDKKTLKRKDVHILLRCTHSAQVRGLALRAAQDPAIVPILRDAIREAEEDGSAEPFLDQQEEEV